MNLKTKLALAEDISWEDISWEVASEEADKDIQVFNIYYCDDCDFDYPDNESGFEEDDDDLEAYSEYDFVDDF